TGADGVGSTITGNGFAPSDSSCTISGSSGLIATSSSCTITGGVINPLVTFGVGNVAPGVYAVTVKGNQAGDSATTAFTVTASGPHITLTPNTGPDGTGSTITGGGFAPSDSSCTISGSNSLIATSSSCTITVGTGVINPAVTFGVGNVAPGTYTVTVKGNQAGDSASATFTVTGPSITLTGTSGPDGTVVAVSGTGFGSGEGLCTISGNGGVVTLPSCGLDGGTPSSSILAGSHFTVGNVAAGTYTITVTGAPDNDKASATFTVTATGPIITLTPNTGADGVGSTITGNGFAPSDSSCTIS